MNYSTLMHALFKGNNPVAFSSVSQHATLQDSMQLGGEGGEGNDRILKKKTKNHLHHLIHNRPRLPPPLCSEAFWKCFFFSLLLPFCLHRFSLTIYGRKWRLRLIGGLEAGLQVLKTHFPVWEQQIHGFRCLVSSCNEALLCLTATCLTYWSVDLLRRSSSHVFLFAVFSACTYQQHHTPAPVAGTNKALHSSAPLTLSSFLS